MESVAAVVALAGIVAAGLVLFATRNPLLAIATALEFFLAAGLLRLSGEPSWPGLAETAAIILLRRLSRLAIGQAERGRQDLANEPPGQATPA